MFAFSVFSPFHFIHPLMLHNLHTCYSTRPIIQQAQDLRGFWVLGSYCLICLKAGEHLYFLSKLSTEGPQLLNWVLHRYLTGFTL